jgi:23S rRNA pseudouridine955/2504/2580 synthase
MKEIIIGKNDSGQRLDKFLQKAFPNLPISLMYKEIRKKNIKLNGKRAEINTQLHQYDSIKLYLNDEFFVTDSNKIFKCVTNELDIIYEDENILLINKKNGMVVHEDIDGSADNLLNRLKKNLYDRGEYDPDSEQSFAPALCNRLDRNTGGIVIAAKNAESLRIINEKIKNREIEKRYLCITYGVPNPPGAVIKAYLKKDEKQFNVKIFDKPNPHSKEIITEYRVLRDNGVLALCEVILHTGRTHQIRAHMAHIGCPLLGDGKYGSERINREFKVKTQALFAYKLKFGFTSDSGILNYLKGMEFSVSDVWFEDKFL